MKKKLLISCLGVFTLFALASCGGQNVPATTQPTQSVTVTEPTAAPEPTTPITAAGNETETTAAPAPTATTTVAEPTQTVTPAPEPTQVVVENGKLAEATFDTSKDSAITVNHESGNKKNTWTKGDLVVTAEGGTPFDKEYEIRWYAKGTLTITFKSEFNKIEFKAANYSKHMEEGMAIESTTEGVTATIEEGYDANGGVIVLSKAVKTISITTTKQFRLSGITLYLE